MKFTHFRYEITSLSPLAVRDPNGNTKFRGLPAKHCSKVYVVSDGAQIIYVGSSTQPIRSRLKGALQADGQHGYYGYPWKASSADLNLDIWILNDLKVEKGKRCIEAETVEAEVVYCVRETDNNWPSHQTEIHFHRSTSSHRNMASTIYNEISKRT